MCALLVVLLLAGCTLDRDGRANGAGGATMQMPGAGGAPNTGGGSSAGGSGGGIGGSGGGSGGSIPDTVGDCIINGDETCDDCNTDSGDGCSSQGQIEPGWVCLAEGEPCNHVSGVGTTAGADTPQTGDQGATPVFEDRCPDGMLLVGFEATDSGDWPGGGEFLSYMAPRCAAPDVDDTGRFRWSGPVTGMVRAGVGDCCVNNTNAYAPLSCPQDGFVVGYRAWSTSYVTQIELYCDGLTFDGSQAVADGAPATVGAMGSGAGTAGSVETCAGYADGWTGSAGAVIDLVGITCASINHTLCGDGVLNGAEACDDGNAISGDGCSDRCQSDL